MLRKATRQKAKIRLGLSAVSGGGKTYSALLIAYGMTNDWGKIAIIDTENGSADLYAHLGDYNVIPMVKFSPEDYIAAIKECEAAGIEVIIVDSITHEWEWCLQEQERLGGRYQDWAKITPRHNAFVKAMINSPAHLITTVRRKQDYDITKDSAGKIKVEKAGLKEVTRDGWEYELTVNLELDVRHYATAGKDRTGMFMDKPAFIPTIETGRAIMEWCNSGAEAITPGLPFFPSKEQDKKKFMDVAKALADGTIENTNGEVVNFTLETVLKKYNLTNDVKQALIDEAANM